MTITRFPITYRNGNCTVTISEDGGKVREWTGDPMPKFPESIDLKVTDACRKSCPWCHESSSPDGRHAEFETIVRLANQLERGMEIAIGGGDAAACYPDLEYLLESIQGRGAIANITMTMDRLTTFPYWCMVHGVGVSVDQATTYSPFGDSLRPPPLAANCVMHVIAGVHSVEEAVELSKANNVLVLGYKRHGRGSDYHSPKVESNLIRWRYFVGTLLRQARRVVSFDNLAIEQLGIESWIAPEKWRRHYMGDDGRFTMYIDAVREEYAASSTSVRKPMGDKTIREMFADVRAEAAR